MKEKVSINDRSIESAGIPKDYKEALAELIWNGFDAGATRVELTFDANEIEHVSELRIRDNGSGIAHKNLPQTFGTLLDSIKRISYQRSSYIRGQKGKGRFSFTTLARRATWNTIINPDGQPFEYDITIHSRNKDEYEMTDLRKVAKDTPTGTEVVLTNLFGITASSFLSESFHEFLCQQFGWFLFLNRKNDFGLLINGEALNYSTIIAEYDAKAVLLDDADGKTWSFDLTFLRWKTRIGDRYYYYFLNQKKRECAKQLTSFNNNAIDFHHSVYVESEFFTDFGVDAEDPGSRLIGKNQSHPIFKAMLKELNSFLEEKEKRFIRQEAAGKLVREYHILGVMPEFSHNAFDESRKTLLENTLQELYAVNPRIFRGLKHEQQKTVVGLLHHLVNAGDKEEFLKVIDTLTPMSEEERNQMRKIAGEVHTFAVARNMNLIERRYSTVSILQFLTKDQELFETEKDQIRSLVAENTWLLSEEYNLTVKNILAGDFLEKSLSILDGNKKAETANGEDAPHERDSIFISRKFLSPSLEKQPYGIETNVLLEVKAPGHVVSQKDNRLAEAYLRYVVKDTQFNGKNQKWKFYLIGDKTDPNLDQQFVSFKKKDRPYLVQAARNYEIYAITWQEIFDHFTQSHNYLLGRQAVERSALEQVLAGKGIKL